MKKHELKKMKVLMCGDCSFHALCKKRQKDIMPCSQMEILCCGKLMLQVASSSDTRHLICSNRDCNNMAVVRFLDWQPPDEEWRNTDGDTC